MRRVVVTGVGFISPIGNTESELTTNLKEGKCGIDRISLFDASSLNVQLAAECRDFKEEDYFSKKEIRRMDRVNMMGIIAARRAVENSKIDFKSYINERVSVQVSSGIGGLNTLEKESFKAHKRGLNKISPFFIPMVIANMTSAHIAIDLGIHGYTGCPVTACAASSNAILDGYRSIKDGYNDVVVAGGAEASINGLGIGGFSSMKALSQSREIERASIPFDLERSGFVMGEGAAILILESLESAIERKANIYGEIVGGHMTCDANHITAPDPKGVFAAEAMKLAIEEKGYHVGQVDYINAHGTSTSLNDKVETLAIHSVFGNHVKNLHVSSTKSMTGHLLGASGAIEAIITFLAMKNSFVPPTINYKEFDPECDLNITANTPIEKPINLSLSNSLGFGGHNVSLALKGWNNEI